MSWVTWLPKSMMRTVSVMSAHLSAPLCRRRGLPRLAQRIGCTRKPDTAPAVAPGQATPRQEGRYRPAVRSLRAARGEGLHGQDELPYIVLARLGAQAPGWEPGGRPRSARPVERREEPQRSPHERNRILPAKGQRGGDRPRQHRRRDG